MLWKKFLEKSIKFQSLVAIFVMLIGTLVFVILMRLFVNSDIEQSLWEVVVLDGADLLEMYGSSAYIPIAIKILYASFLVFSIAIWQAIIIFKMLLTSPDIQISEVFCYYNSERRAEGQDYDSVVFGMVNRSKQNLFNVKVKAQLRVNIQNVLRLYNLKVTAPEIPMLEHNMPFKVYIRTGKISNVDRSAYFLTDDQMNPVSQGKPISLNLVEDDALIDLRKSGELLVFIEVFDDLLDQNNITFKKFKFSEIKEKCFTSINPSPGTDGSFYFKDRDIDENFNRLN